MDNIKVMLVDDEVLAVEYLRNMIPWEEYGFEVVAEASDGRKALEKYEKYKPQIVFLDIRMPVMDGLEFCKKTVKPGSPLKIILLTAYKDFDYARQAMGLGVTSYILKHDINRKTILNELKKAKNELAQEESSLRIIRQNYFRDLLHGINSGSHATNFRIDMKSENFILILLQVDQPFTFGEEYFLADENLPLTVIDILDRKLPHFVNYIERIEADEKRFAAIVSIKKVYSRMEIINAVYDLSRSIQKKFRDVSDSTISIAVSDIIYNMEKLHAEYNKLLGTIDFRVFFGREKIFMFDSYPVLKEADKEEVSQGLSKVSRALNELKPEELSPVLDRLFAAVELSPGWLKKACNSLKILLDEYNKKHNHDLLEDNIKKGIADFSCWYDIKGLKQWFLKEFETSIEKSYKMKYGVISKKTQQALLFIHKNFREDLSIEQVAREVDISSVYLMKLFQKEIGQTFLEYLTSYRVETAKRLINGGKLKIYEISEMVGYKSSQYFSQVFKKLTGINPLDYKDGEKPDENGY